MFPVCVLHEEITMAACKASENDFAFTGLTGDLSALTLLVFPAAAVIFIVTVDE